MKLPDRLPRSPTAIVATLVLLLVLVPILLIGTGIGTESNVEFGSGPPPLADYTYATLTVGMGRDQVEKRVGAGEDALEYGETGLATERLDADCRYYPRTSNVRNLVQLCYREDKLISKRHYPATAGPPLSRGAS